MDGDGRTRNNQKDMPGPCPPELTACGAFQEVNGQIQCKVLWLQNAKKYKRLGDQREGTFLEVTHFLAKAQRMKKLDHP